MGLTRSKHTDALVVADEGESGKPLAGLQRQPAEKVVEAHDKLAVRSEGPDDVPEAAFRIGSVMEDAVAEDVVEGGRRKVEVEKIGLLEASVLDAQAPAEMFGLVQRGLREIDAQHPTVFQPEQQGELARPAAGVENATRGGDQPVERASVPGGLPLEISAAAVLPRVISRERITVVEVPNQLGDGVHVPVPS